MKSERLRSVVRRIAQLAVENETVAFWPFLSQFLKEKSLVYRLKFLRLFQKEFARCRYQSACCLSVAAPIKPNQVAELEKKFSQKIGKPIKFRAQIQPELLAGISVKIGDRRWECSLKKTLEQWCA